MSKVILYIAASLDGYIADKDGGVDWLPHHEDPDDEVGYKALLSRISTIIMGRRSYEQILGFGPWAWVDKQTYVFTHQNLQEDHPEIAFVQENPKTFMEQWKGGDIWLLGGAQLAHSFFKDQLVDECILTQIPLSLGAGIPLNIPLDEFSLRREKPCMLGIHQKVYVRN